MQSLLVRYCCTGYSFFTIGRRRANTPPREAKNFEDMGCLWIDLARLSSLRGSERILRVVHIFMPEIKKSSSSCRRGSMVMTYILGGGLPMGNESQSM